MKVLKLICIFIFILALSSCSIKKSTELVSSKVIYDTVLITNVDPDRIDEQLYIAKVKNKQSFNKQFNILGLDEKASLVFHEDIFKDKEILIVSFPTSSTPKYNISHIDKKDNDVTIYIDKKRPKDIHDDLRAVCMFISIKKGQLAESDVINVKFNEIITQ